MKRFPVWRTLVVIALFGVLVMLPPAPPALAATRVTFGITHVNNATHRASGPSEAFACIGGVAFTLAAFAIAKEPVSVMPFSGVVPTCIEAIYDLFNNSPNSSPSGQGASSSTPSGQGASSLPEIKSASSTDGASYGSAQSLVQNCTDNQEKLTFSEPFQMVVGSPQSPEGQEVFTGPPNGSSSDDEVIAQELFQQFGLASNYTNGPGQAATYDMPSHTQATLNLPIVLYYKFGGARVVHPDGSSDILPWLFTDGYQLNGQITMSNSSSC